MKFSTFKNTLMAPSSASYLLFISAFLIFCLRNLDPITYPTLYAEDGVWTADLLTNGFYDTAFNTRVFPILGFISFYQLGLYFTEIFLDSNLVYLPLVYFVLSNIFMATLTVIAFKVMSKYLSKLAVISIVTAILFLPVGGDSNEIYGRILNLGFIFPFVQVLLLIELFRASLSKCYIAFIIVFSMVSGLTFPIGLGISCIAIALILYYSFTSSNKIYYYRIAGLLLFSVVISVLTLSTSTFTSEGGANLPFEIDAFVEFSIARSILYPIVFYFYKHLNDFYVLLLISLTTITSATIIYRRYRKSSGDEKLAIILMLWSSFILYLAAMVVMRNGLTSIFDDYTSSFPDRYFTGLNLLFITSLIFTLDLYRITRAVIVIVTLPILLTATKRLELSEPSMKFDAVAPWTISICQYQLDRSQQLGVIDIPPKGWQLELPKYILDDHNIQGCSYSPFYDFYPLSKLQPAVLIYKSLNNNQPNSAVTSVSGNNGVIIATGNDYTDVHVNKYDPSVILTVTKGNKPTNAVRVSVSFNVHSEKNGQLQLYYQTPEEPFYSESNSILIPISHGSNELNISLSSYVLTETIRLDFPDILGLTYKIDVKNNNQL